MGTLKKASAIFLSCLLITVPVLSVSAAGQEAAETRAASRYCKNCGQMTPFIDCGTCKLTNQTAPYHCHVCGGNFEDGGICPSWS